ncbi:MAG: ABC transporter substrate-binding protein, partial [Eubacteriales bacterium]|nr:ABC transporter substrate-binding protein [Eubacteriales bacterium]
AAADAGISLMFQDANQKQENQISALRSFIAYQVDVIAFAPIVEDGWENVLQEAHKAGIPVILVDRMVDVADENLYAAYVGADFYAEGVRAGEFLLRKANDLGRERLNVVEISGTEDATPTLQRHQGFHNIVDGDERIVTLTTVSGDFLRSKGKERMEELLAAYGADIDVLYSHNDAMTLGAIDAMEEAGIVPGKDVVVITVDGEQAAIDLLKAGKINCVVECTPMLGPLVMELTARLIAGETIARETHPQEQVFTEYDDLSGLAPRGY